MFTKKININNSENIREVKIWNTIKIYVPFRKREI